MNIIEKLRLETRTYQSDLENCQLLSQLMRDNLTQEKYKAVLSKFFSYYSPIESNLISDTSIQADLPDIASRKKIMHLFDDLIHLGLSGSDIKAIPMCSYLPDLSTPAKFMGYLYVTEGSAMGRQFVHKKLMSQLDLTEENGCSFFNAYGVENMDMWKTFCLKLNEFAQTHNCDEEIIQASKDAFQKLKTWMDV
ncbi:MAG: heme oxygenase [Candidatus Omnitrophota bacterium]|jgi:heme oxygenase